MELTFTNYKFNPASIRAVCSVDDDCVEGEYLKFGHGPMTGRCVDSDVDKELR